MNPELRLTIGAFARRSRLSVKALRLYEEHGLLSPATSGPPCLKARRAIPWSPSEHVAGPPREVYFVDFMTAGPADEVADVAFPIA